MEFETARIVGELEKGFLPNEIVNAKICQIYNEIK